MDCGMSMVKYLLFVFNLLCALCGIVFIVLGSIFLAHVSNFKEFIDELGAQQIPIGFIVLGALIFLIAFFGCCGAIRESYCMSMTYAVALFVLIVLDIALVVYVFVARKSIQDLINQVINKLWKTASTDSSAFKGLQAALHCCGRSGPLDWAGLTLPASCCAPDTTLPACTIAEAYQTGCSEKLSTFVNTNIDTIGYVGIGICVIEVIGFIFACCLANHIRNFKRRAAY